MFIRLCPCPKQICMKRFFSNKNFTVGFILSAVVVVVAFISLVWTPYAWMVLLIMGYGLYSFLVSIGFLYPKFDWDDPRRMVNRRSALPALGGSIIYSLIAIVIAQATYIFAHNSPLWAIPIVIMGLALLAGGTWFFVHWSTVRVEAAWPSIGVD